jgi:hypothetical protein
LAVYEYSWLLCIVEGEESEGVEAEETLLKVEAAVGAGVEVGERICCLGEE